MRRILLYMSVFISLTTCWGASYFIYLYLFPLLPDETHPILYVYIYFINYLLRWILFYVCIYFHKYPLRRILFYMYLFP